MNKTYKCTCKKDKGTVTINHDIDSGKYGITGLVDMYDCRLGNGTVICNKCKEVIYKYEDYRHVEKKRVKKVK